MSRTPLDHLALLRVDLAAFVDAVAIGPAGAPIDGCPGWTLADLGAHLGGVHRWVIGAISTGGVPPATDDTAPTGDLRELSIWVRDGGNRLVALLEATDPAAPTWHPFPVEPKLAGLWRRRQCQEASVHRWDAERAIGGAPCIAADLAADGVDEYWTVMLPRMLVREQRTTPGTVVEVQLTDTGDRWVVDGSTGRPVVTADAQPVALLQGDAESVLLRLWGRPADRPPMVTGDSDAMQAWLALGGA